MRFRHETAWEALLEHATGLMSYVFPTGIQNAVCAPHAHGPAQCGTQSECTCLLSKKWLFPAQSAQG